MQIKRTIRNLHPAIREDIADLETYRALPVPSLKMIDPFLFLNHHGYQIYNPGNSGLPFGPHPHRGFETVTFILEGDILHRDSAGHESIIHSGGIQWMTAGKGLIHSETSSDDFKRNGGPLEILQLWINLPASLKMSPPNYTGLQKNEITNHTSDNGKVEAHIVSGEWGNHVGPYRPLTDITAVILEIKSGGVTKFKIDRERSIFFYVIQGKLEVNGNTCGDRTTVEFNSDGDYIEIVAEMDSKILLCHAYPIVEPVVTYGPFVMNTREEIEVAIRDFQSGKFD